MLSMRRAVCHPLPAATTLVRYGPLQAENIDNLANASPFVPSDDEPAMDLDCGFDCGTPSVDSEAVDALVFDAEAEDALIAQQLQDVRQATERFKSNLLGSNGLCTFEARDEVSIRQHVRDMMDATEDDTASLDAPSAATEHTVVRMGAAARLRSFQETGAEQSDIDAVIQALEEETENAIAVMRNAAAAHSAAVTTGETVTAGETESTLSPVSQFFRDMKATAAYHGAAAQGNTGEAAAANAGASREKKEIVPLVTA